jgi:hypothetical protein
MSFNLDGRDRDREELGFRVTAVAERLGAAPSWGRGR